MQVKNTTPKIRFKGFTEAWEQRKLNDVAVISKGKQINKSELLDSGKYYVLNGGMSPSGYTDKYNTLKDTISISEGGNSCGYVAYNDKNFWSGGHNYTLSQLKIDTKFLYQYLKGHESMIMALRVGSGLPNIQKSRLSEVHIASPQQDCEEQKRIGNMLGDFDNLITLHQRKLEKIKNFKKSMLEKIFPKEGKKVPELRFKGFNDKWEETILGNECGVITKQTGFDYSATIKPSLVKNKNRDTYPFIQNKDFNGLNINMDTDFYIPKKVANSFPKILIDQPSLLISISGAIGNVGFYNKSEKAFIGGAVGICKVKNESFGQFAMYEFLSPLGQKHFKELIKASSHQNITVEDIRKLKILHPKDANEQKTLIKFFNILDNQIKFEQEKIDKLSRIKYSLVSKMLV